MKSDIPASPPGSLSPHLSPPTAFGTSSQLPMNRIDDQFLSPYEDSRPGTPSPPGPWHDPRMASTQSLVPSETGADREGKRRLLMIYIHGFYGNNRSFNSFPAHAHAYLKEALRESHVVHTKIYPRYKTYHAIGVGAQSFSSWLEPHEDDTTDVVLVGHSMGGILAAEVVLMPNPNPFGAHQFKHRILGVLALDTPFLGLHPGIIPTGIASLFRSPPENTSLSPPKPKPSAPGVGQTRSAPELIQELSNVTTTTTTTTTAATTTAAASLSHYTDSVTDVSTQPTTRNSSDSIRPSLESAREVTSSPGPPEPPHRRDPNFDPPWFNDTVLKDRSFFKSVAHFTRKHFSEGVFSAAGKHFMSHMEYGACLADYPGLHSRYNQMRALEDVDDFKALASDIVMDEPNFRVRAVRVRFVNYYTSSTGRIKPVKLEEKQAEETDGQVVVEEGPKQDTKEGVEDGVVEETAGSSKTLGTEDHKVGDVEKAKGLGAEHSEVETKLSTPRISVELDENDGVAEVELTAVSPIAEDELQLQPQEESQEVHHETPQPAPPPEKPEIEGLPDIPPPPTHHP
ncbi:hypothetical protein jhhlp_002477 [Lomentospora prolificans]|uniref:AB hydrolase-1 domain-containing protein n=1 Tax=Lomentospora prolificans TaxID=41688 RepID=A0A2N3NE42_9PEZI|nr:hypothetical protein jhhlp_002477 [Lomentospora prolificans]